MELQLLNNSSLKFKSKIFLNGNEFLDNNGCPTWIHFLRPQFEKIGHTIKHLNYENLDRSKPYLINLFSNSQYWFVYNDDILSGLPESLIDDLGTGKAYLLINNDWESWSRKILSSIYKKLSKSKLNPLKVIYLCNAIDIESEHYKICIEKNIPRWNQIKVLYSPHVFNNWPYILKFFEHEKNVAKTKRFLCLNRVVRDHRLMLAGMLSYHKLLDKGFYSLGTTTEQLEKFMRSKPQEIVEGLKKIQNSVPIVLDTDDFKTNHVGWDSLPIEYYQKSYFSLVSGTYALREQECSRGINEKELKPILAKHPFLLWNRPFTLKYLRSEGFLTFDKWFDESYDNEEDDYKRLTMIVQEVKRLCSIPSKTLDTIIDDMAHVLDHNYVNATERLSDRVFYSSDLKYFLNYIS